MSKILKVHAIEINLCDVIQVTFSFVQIDTLKHGKEENDRICFTQSILKIQPNYNIEKIGINLLLNAVA